MSGPEKTVLIVDDLVDNQILLEGLLEDDYKTKAVSSGKECFAYLESDEERPVLILLDLMMPEMDGFEVCTKLKADPQTHDIPVIFVTAEEGIEEKLKAFEIGGDDFVKKPFNHDELLAKVKKSLAAMGRLNSLHEQASMSQNAAMQAMITSSELGRLVQFMEQSSQYEDFNSLALKLLEVTEEFGVICCFQFVTADGLFNIGNGCDNGTIEAKLLEAARKKGRIVGTGERVFFSQEHVSMLVKNMPVSDDDLCGRLRDHFAVFMNAAENVARTVNYKDQVESQRRGTAMAAIETVHREMGNIGVQLAEFGKETTQVLQDIHDEFEQALFSLGLTEEQERYLLDMFDQGYDKLQLLKKKEDDITHSFDRINNKMSALIN